jgi:ribosomal protein L34E
MDNAISEEMPVLEPLKIHCTDTRCESGLHCFSPNRRKKNWEKEYHGQCQACGVQLVSWDCVRARDIRAVSSTFEELQKEFIRHEYFHKPFDDEARREAQSLGFAALKKRARDLLSRKIGPEKIFRDGTQTSLSGSALFYAQHATATCCRKCLEYWHGIERGRALTDEELDYCEGLVLSYLELRAAELFAKEVAGDARDP